MYRCISENICVLMIRTNCLVSPKLFRTPISTKCIQNWVYNYPSKRGLAAGGSLGLHCSEHVTETLNNLKGIKYFIKINIILVFNNIYIKKG